MIPDYIEPRVAILSQLRRMESGSKAAGLPELPSPVTHAEGASLAKLFGSKLEEISGSCDILDRAADVADRIVELAKDWNAEDGDATADAADPQPIEVLSWRPKELPLDGLKGFLKDSGISLLVPDDLHDESWRARAARPSIGLTSVDAAFASTGSLVLAPGHGRSRAASLLPLRHLAIVPMSRIHPTFEAWLATLRREERLSSYLRVSGQIAFITGPSKSADIEQILTLGVHGPRTVHALVFDDTR